MREPVVAVFEVNPPQNIAIAALPYCSVAVFTSCRACSSESAGFYSGRSFSFLPLGKVFSGDDLAIYLSFFRLVLFKHPFTARTPCRQLQEFSPFVDHPSNLPSCNRRRRHIQSSHFYTNVDLEDVTRELGDTRCNRR